MCTWHSRECGVALRVALAGEIHVGCSPRKWHSAGSEGIAIHSLPGPIGKQAPGRGAGCRVPNTSRAVARLQRAAYDTRTT